MKASPSLSTVISSAPYSVQNKMKRVRLFSSLFFLPNITTQLTFDLQSANWTSNSSPMITFYILMTQVHKRVSITEHF